MIKNVLLATSLIASAAGAMAQKTTYTERARAYIAQYKDWAIAEQRRSGVPASITLAQGILETEAGNSELATQANNHFGIKCKKEWTGETFAHDDDAPQECFRKYPTALQSYKDHSDYLKTGKRYQSCFAQNPSDYKSWARELRKCGYATNPKYAPLLIRIVEDFSLQDYTYAALTTQAPPPVLLASAASPAAAVVLAESAQEKKEAAAAEQDTPKDQPVYGQVIRKDGLRGFYAHKGDVLLEYAIQYKMRYARLLEINGLPDAPLPADQFVYLEKGSRVAQIISRDASTPAAAYGAPVAEVRTPASAAGIETPAQPVAVTAPTRGQSTLVNTDRTPAEVAPSATNSVEQQGARDERQVAAPTPVLAPVQQPPAVAATPADQPAAKPVNIADEVAVEEEAPAKTEDAPKDEFSRMKARFDKVVYAPAPEPKSAASQRSAPAPTSAPATASVTRPSAPVLASASGAGGYHIVRSGETAFGIARQYGISMKELMAMNNLNFEAIKVGQKLKVK